MWVQQTLSSTFLCTVPNTISHEFNLSFQSCVIGCALQTHIMIISSTLPKQCYIWNNILVPLGTVLNNIRVFIGVLLYILNLTLLVGLIAINLLPPTFAFYILFSTLPKQCFHKFGFGVISISNLLGCPLRQLTYDYYW